MEARFISGDQHETYVLCMYSASGGEDIPVYILTSKYDMESKLQVDERLQYGMQDGVLFQVMCSMRMCESASLLFCTNIATSEDSGIRVVGKLSVAILHLPTNLHLHLVPFFV